MKNKLNIGICDDDPVQIEIIKGFINRINTAYEFNIIQSFSTKQFIEESRKQKLDIVFLDIQIDENDGIYVGNHIRDINSDAIIVYITGFKDYCFNAFKIRAFDYILKPITEEKFSNIMSDIFLRFKQIKALEEKSKFIILETKTSTLNLKYEEIIYFEKILRKIKAHTINGEFEFYGSFREIMDNLDMKYFIQCHQGYIVNKNKILQLIDNNIYIRDINKEIPVSRRLKTQVKQILQDNIFS